MVSRQLVQLGVSVLVSWSLSVASEVEGQEQASRELEYVLLASTHSEALTFVRDRKNSVWSSLLQTLQNPIHPFMGHGNSNKLYITHEEHTGKFGSHSASVGYKLYANPVFQMFGN